MKLTKHAVGRLYAQDLTPTDPINRWKVEPLEKEVRIVGFNLGRPTQKAYFKITGREGIYRTDDEALAAVQKEMDEGMNTENITLSLIPAETDPPLRSPEYQQELEEVTSALSAEGMKISYVVELEESAGSETVLLGTFTVDLAKTVGPALGAVGVAVAAWLQGRYGRKVRLKIGDFEAEARTVEEVEKLMEHAKRFRQPK